MTTPDPVGEVCTCGSEAVRFMYGVQRDCPVHARQPTTPDPVGERSEKPTERGHVLTVRVVHGRPHYSVECLNAVDGKDRVCGSVSECDEHVWPEGGEDEEWEDCTDESAVTPERWAAYQQACADYEDEHPIVGWHANDACWLDETVRYGDLGGSWHFEEGFAPGVGEHPIGWENDCCGGPEDAVLIVTPRQKVAR